MVDLAEIQAAYYMVAATGVLVAAAFYILNLRMSQRTLRINVTNNLLQTYQSEEGQKSFLDLMYYEWSDYEDFDRKYGSKNNRDATAKRFWMWETYNNMGMMLRKGFVDIDVLNDMGLQGIVYFWEKYKPIVVETRRRYNGKDYCRDMEYLAVEMLRYIKGRDPSYRIPDTMDMFEPNK
jgi:hypothetical protein